MFYTEGTPRHVFDDGTNFSVFLSIFYIRLLFYFWGAPLRTPFVVYERLSMLLYPVP